MCDRGLARSPGASGRTWLLQIKAEALTQKGQAEEAHQALKEALESAQSIPDQMMRDMKVGMISDALKTAEADSSVQKRQ